MGDKISIFSNAFEFILWRENNCDECAMDCPVDDNGNYGDTLCKVEEAISLASVNDGKITKEQADIAGLPFKGGGRSCKNFVQAQLA